LKGVYSATGRCSHTNSSGGCLQNFGPTEMQTTWYYSPTTVQDVQVTCTNDGNATYVAP
jgi:hypothetical protein